MDGVVTLGGFVFRDFETPSKLPIGGKQEAKVQEMVGGARVVDAMVRRSSYFGSACSGWF
jgi:hypothetical protein